MSQFEPEQIGIVRERVVLEEIRKHPHLHHNALMSRIVPQFMAKSTFEKTRNNLIEKNLISCHVKGNRKYYTITENYQKKSLLLIERITISNFHFLQNELKHLKDDYHHKDVHEKISNGIQLVKELFQTDNGFTILDSIKNSKKTLYKDEHLEIQEMIYFVLQIISEDKDIDLIFPSIMSCIGFNFTKNFDEKK